MDHQEVDKQWMLRALGPLGITFSLPREILVHIWKLIEYPGLCPGVYARFTTMNSTLINIFKIYRWAADPMLDTGSRKIMNRIVPISITCENDVNFIPNAVRLIESKIVGK